MHVEIHWTRNAGGVVTGGKIALPYVGRYLMLKMDFPYQQAGRNGHDDADSSPTA
jgi:hypothetical protein